MKNQIILPIMLILAFSTISAFGVSSPYWIENPLIMSKGETKFININLQNMAEEDIKVKAEVIQGADIISLEESTFVIKAQTSNTLIPVKIIIPKNMPENNKTIKIEFKKIIEGEQGIPIGTGMSVSFKVITSGEVIEKPHKEVFIWIILVIFLVVLWTIVKKRKNKILNTLRGSP